MGEYNLDKESKKTCWLFEYGCPSRTGGCHSGLPDSGCPVYRWFKEVVEWQKKNRPEHA